MIPAVKTHVDPATGQVHIQFVPDPDSWEFVKTTRDELRDRLTTDVETWLSGFPDTAAFDEGRLRELRARVLFNILAWVSSGEIKLP